MVMETESSRLTHAHDATSKTQQSTDFLRWTSIDMIYGSTFDLKVRRIVPSSFDRVRSVQWH